MLQLKNFQLEPSAPSFEHDFIAESTTVILGKNRSGKTNLCRFIAGLHSTAKGNLILDGSNISTLKPQHRSVAFVFQSFVNYPTWSVEENISSPLRAKGASIATRKNLVDQLATMLGLASLLKRLPNELSGGQQQRLAIARALAQQPRVLVLDEPLVNLDYKLRESLSMELSDLLKQNKTTVIYTSTTPQDAFTLGEQVLLLEDHKKIQSGPTLTVYLRPNTIKAANLMSEPEINLITTSSEDTHRVIQTAVRPEHVYLSNSEPTSDTQKFQFQVRAIETSGDETFIHGKVKDSNWVIRQPGLLEIPIDATLSVAVRKTDLLRFPSS